jgi:hypothetical protein
MDDVKDDKAFTATEDAIRELSRLIANLKRKKRAILKRAAAAPDPNNFQQRANAIIGKLRELVDKREAHLKEVGRLANAAFSDVGLLNEFLFVLDLPHDHKTPEDAVRALKRARVNINIYDVVSREFSPLFDTVELLGRSIKKDGRIFPRMLAKSSALKLFLRKVRHYM